MLERYQYNGAAGILDGIGSVGGPCELRVDLSDPRVRRLVEIGTLVSCAAVAEPAVIAATHGEDELYGLRKAELADIASGLGVDTAGLTKDELVVAILAAEA